MENKENWRNFVDPRPENNVILWSWTRHPSVRSHYDDRFNDPEWSHLELVRLRSQPEVDAFVDRVQTS